MLDNENTDPENDYEDVLEFAAWLESAPPFELVGRVVVAAAEVEAALRSLLMHRLSSEHAWAVTHSMGHEQVRLAFLRLLKSVEVPTDSDSRLLELLQGDVRRVQRVRNVVAHGLWLPLFRRGMAVVNHRSDKPELSGQMITNEELETTVATANAIEVEIRALVLHELGGSAS